ncbi:Chromo domain-containing protein [Mycena kentingensis (nom. inval.)]|nr:Chromo domain-containing protein [Mycena kentingensis (nom. inval.)]
MAKASPVPSSGDEATSKPPSRAASKKQKDDAEDVPDSEPDAEAEGEDEEGDEEEYEIEAVLRHAKGRFEKGQMGYFVRWKNYDESHDSWVSEEDAAGAQELIDAYWKTKKKPAASASTASRRKSRAQAQSDDDDEPVESVSAPPKKRGRPPKAKAAEDDDDAMEVDEDRPVKKARKAKKELDDAAETLPADEDLGNMDEYRDAPSWDHLIERVETVERRDDDELYIYFSLKTGERIRETNQVCHDKFPKMLLDFYETNLRWRESDNKKK